MIDPQTVFQRISNLKKEQKELKTAYRDALAHDKHYQESLEAAKVARERKATLESKVRADFGPEFERLDELKQSIADEEMILSDLAFNSVVKGERVELYDEYEAQYEPIVTVKFKKTNKFKDKDKA
jgi:hypothetical protein